MSSNPLTASDDSRPDHCAAVRAQADYFEWEETLYAAAHVKHRTAAWWWGMRRTPVAFGAYCYICDQTIVTWASNYPVTRKALAAIEGHKILHRAQLLADTAKPDR